MAAPRIAFTAPQRVLVVVLVVGLTAAAVVLGVRYTHDRQRADRLRAVPAAEQSALSAARAEAVALTSIDYRTASRDVGRILAGATGSLRTQFAAQQAKFPSVLSRTKSVSKGTALSSALSSLSGSTAQALVAVDATVTGTGAGPNGVLKHYRMVITMQRSSGRWLASDVAFAGAPQ